MQLSEQVKSDSNFNGETNNIVCMGGDWYTFPSHFFLPDNVRLGYIRDGFGGQLPKHFSAINGTSEKPSCPFNDQNKEEMSSYIDIDKCDYLIRLITEDDRSKEDKTIFLDEKILKRLSTTKIIDSANSPIFTRALFLPGIEYLLPQYKSMGNKFHQYTLFRHV